MANSKTTKKALLSSALALTMCVAMLIATTFAWFTDTASTSVNKIQAGKLDVGLFYASGEDDSGNTTWENAEGKTLGWMQKTAADGKATMVTTDGKPLWEPGCTYTLPELKIVNNGDLELKYKIGITGIDGDAKLDEVIDWTMELGDVAEDKEALGKDHRLAAKPDSGESASTFTISGHMKEEAGNEYQGLSIDGISITVYATQATGEYDSKSNTYDEDAEYNLKSATIMGTDGVTTTLESGKTYNIGNAIVTVNGQDITYTNNNGEEKAQKVTITTESGNLTVNAEHDTVKHYGDASRVVINGVEEKSYHEFGKVDILEIAKGRVVVENGNNIAVLQVKPADNTTVPIVAVPQSVVLETKLQVENGKGVEVAVIDTGGEKIEAESFEIKKSGDKVNNEIPAELEKVLSKDGEGAVTLEEPKNYAAMIGTTPYETFAKAVNAVKANETIKLVDDATIDSSYSVNNRLYVDAQNVTIDLNNKTLTVPNYTLSLSGDDVTLKRGKVVASKEGSYAIVANGKNVIIDGVTIDGLSTTGGISVSGWDKRSSTTKTGVSATIKNCNITATNYYAVCAQDNAAATIENSTLTCESGYNFFWIENGKSSITYDSKNVTLVGNKPLYNDSDATYGAPVVKNLTVKDAEGNEKTVDAVAVSTYAHLKAALDADKSVMLADNIGLTGPITIGHTSTSDELIAVVGDGHKLDGSALTGNDVNNPRAINVYDGTNMTVILKDLTVVGPLSDCGSRGISTGDDKNTTLILDNCNVSAKKYAININKFDSGTTPTIIVRNTKIDNKTMQGYCAFQTNISGTKATFENCTLVGNNWWDNDGDNDFSTIVLYPAAKNSILTFKNCRIEANEKGEGKTPADETFLSVRAKYDENGTIKDSATGATVTFEGCRFFLNGRELTGDAIKNEMEVLNDTALTIE